MQRFLYLGVTSSSGDQVGRIRLSDFTEQGVENVTAPGSLRFAVVDPFATTFTSPPPPGRSPSCSR